MKRIQAAVGLLLRFVRAVLVSGLQTVAVIVKSGRPGGEQPSTALLRVRYAPMSDAGAGLLGSMVSLTPGTTTIDIDNVNRELLLHVLDSSDTDALVAGIREDFEPGLRVLFGRESMS